MISKYVQSSIYDMSDSTLKKMYYFLGPYNDRFLGFSLFVSNTTNTSDGFLCFKDRGVYNKSTIPVIFNTNCSVHGQYVIYYNERLPGITYPDGYSKYAYNDLCEVEVYGKSRCTNTQQLSKRKYVC